MRQALPRPLAAAKGDAKGEGREGEGKGRGKIKEERGKGKGSIKGDFPPPTKGA